MNISQKSNCNSPKYVPTYDKIQIKLFYIYIAKNIYRCKIKNAIFNSRINKSSHKYDKWNSNIIEVVINENYNTDSMKHSYLRESRLDSKHKGRIGES